jgi:anti-sigma B factor antagonist
MSAIQRAQRAAEEVDRGCWGRGYIVTPVDDFPPDIIGLQVAEHGPDARVVTVTGEVDTITAPRLATFLYTQLAAARIVVVDLDGVEFLGSAGLSALFEAHELATREDRALRMVCHSRIANRALEATALREHFTFADSVADALQHSP